MARTRSQIRHELTEVEREILKFFNADTLQDRKQLWPCECSRNAKQWIDLCSTCDRIIKDYAGDYAEHELSRRQPGLDFQRDVAILMAMHRRDYALQQQELPELEEHVGGYREAPKEVAIVVAIPKPSLWVRTWVGIERAFMSLLTFYYRRTSRSITYFNNE